MLNNRRWLLRVALEDRPGALASLATTLAVHDVDILRIDVVSRDGIAVDDLWIDLPPDEPAETLITVIARLPGVSILSYCPVLLAEDPVSVMAAACAQVAEAPTPARIRTASLEGACRIASADNGVLVQPRGDGSLRVAASSTPDLPDVSPDDPCLARQAASYGLSLGARGDGHWGPETWRDAIGAVASVAAVPLTSTDGSVHSCLLLLRENPSIFQPGELTRLDNYGRMLSALLRARGEHGASVPAEAWLARESLAVAAAAT